MEYKPNISQKVCEGVLWTCLLTQKKVNVFVTQPWKHCSYEHKVKLGTPTQNRPLKRPLNGPRAPLPCILLIFPCSSTPDSNKWVIISPLLSFLTTHSFESGVLEEGNISNVQGRGRSWGPGLREAAPHGSASWLSDWSSPPGVLNSRAPCYWTETAG